MSAAAEIQRARDVADLANHRERLQWLESGTPRWACGALVDSHSRNVLTQQSREVIQRLESRETK